jgi:hypothetical protein
MPRLRRTVTELANRDGSAPDEAVVRFLAAVGDLDAFPDRPGYDRRWLAM